MQMKSSSGPLKGYGWPAATLVDLWKRPNNVWFICKDFYSIESQRLEPNNIHKDLQFSLPRINIQDHLMETVPCHP